MNDFIRRLKNLCLCEADGAGGGGEGAETTPTNTATEDDKKFTQADLNRIGATEKASGKRAVLKALGFETEEDALAFINTAREDANAKKTETERAAETLVNEQKKSAAAEARASELENKLSILKAGGNPANVDDLAVLVASRIKDDVTFDQALEEVKKNYPSLFGIIETGSGTGTGGTRPHTQSKDKGDNIGARLGKARRESQKTEVDFFK